MQYAICNNLPNNNGFLNKAKRNLKKYLSLMKQITKEIINKKIIFGSVKLRFEFTHIGISPK